MTASLHDLTTFEPLARELGDALRAKGWTLAVAESCTGGLVAAACTSIAGSSDWFDAGFVTYSNAAKSAQLGVPAALIERCGAVSDDVAQAMALGALAHSRATIALAITGIAGPGGGVPGKPVGTVWLAWARRDLASPFSECLLFQGERASVREQAARRALQHGMKLAAGLPLSP